MSSVWHFLSALVLLTALGIVAGQDDHQVKKILVDDPVIDRGLTGGGGGGGGEGGSEETTQPPESEAPTATTSGLSPTTSPPAATTQQLQSATCQPSIRRGTVSPPSGDTHFLNSFDSPLMFVCPNNGPLTKIFSVHNNWYEDRLHNFQCSHLVKDGQAVAVPDSRCHWSTYTRFRDLYADSVCPGSRYIAGWRSEHSNQMEDRRMSFRCCYAPGYVIMDNCQDSPYINQLDEPLLFTVSTNRGYVLTGVHSNFQYGNNDRRFSFKQCEISQVSG